VSQKDVGDRVWRQCRCAIGVSYDLCLLLHWAQLYLYESRIDDAGAAELSKALAPNCTLTEVCYIHYSTRLKTKGTAVNEHGGWCTSSMLDGSHFCRDDL